MSDLEVCGRIIFGYDLPTILLISRVLCVSCFDVNLLYGVCDWLINKACPLLWVTGTGWLELHRSLLVCNILSVLAYNRLTAAI